MRKALPKKQFAFFLAFPTVSVWVIIIPLSHSFVTVAYSNGRPCVMEKIQ